MVYRFPYYSLSTAIKIFYSLLTIWWYFQQKEIYANKAYKYVWLYYGYDEFTLDGLWGTWGTTPLAIYLEQTTFITMGKRAYKSRQN